MWEIMYYFYNYILCLGLILSIKPVLNVPSPNNYDADEFLNEMISSNKTKFKKLMDKIVNDTVDKINTRNQMQKRNESEKLKNVREPDKINGSSMLFSTSSLMPPLGNISFNNEKLKANKNSRFMRQKELNDTSLAVESQLKYAQDNKAHFKNITTTTKNGSNVTFKAYFKTMSEEISHTRKKYNGLYPENNEVITNDRSTRYQFHYSDKASPENTYYAMKNYHILKELEKNSSIWNVNKTKQMRFVIKPERDSEDNNDSILKKDSNMTNGSKYAYLKTPQGGNTTADIASKESGEMDYTNETSHGNNPSAYKELTNINKINESNKSNNAKTTLQLDLREVINKKSYSVDIDVVDNKYKTRDLKITQSVSKEIPRQYDVSFDQTYPTIKNNAKGKYKKLKDLKKVKKKYLKSSVESPNQNENLNSDKESIKKGKKKKRKFVKKIRSDYSKEYKYSNKVKKYTYKSTVKSSKPQEHILTGTEEINKIYDTIENKKNMTDNMNNTNFEIRDVNKRNEAKYINGAMIGIYENINCSSLNHTEHLNKLKSNEFMEPIKLSESQKQQLMGFYLGKKRTIGNDSTIRTISNDNTIREVINSDEATAERGCKNVEKHEYQLMKHTFDKIDKIYQIVKTFTKNPEVNVIKKITNDTDKKKSYSDTARSKNDLNKKVMYANDKRVFVNNKHLFNREIVPRTIPDEIEESNLKYLAKSEPSSELQDSDTSCSTEHCGDNLRRNSIEPSSVESYEIPDSITGDSSKTSVDENTSKKNKVSQELEHLYVYL